MLPPEQSSHVVAAAAPVTPEYVPAAQLTQLSEDIALFAIKYFPAGQLTHAAAVKLGW
jgi:hypothetical protein